MAVSAPADRRFRRVHVRPARRRPSRPSRYMVLRGALALAVVCYGGYQALHHVRSTGALTVTHISVTGDTHMARGEVLALLDGLQGENLVAVDLEDWRQTLLGSPWVADAALRRRFPDSISVVVSERQPMGIARLGNGLYLIDARGTIIDEFGPNHAQFDLPLIDGLSAGRPADGTTLDEGRVALAARLLAHVQRRPDLANRISQIDVTDPRGAAVLLKGDATLVRLGDDHFAERLDAYLELEPALRERIPQIDYVDVRFDDRVYVRPQSSGARVQSRQDPVRDSGGRTRGTTGGGW